MSCTQDTSSIALSIGTGALTATLKISADAGNIASVHADGLWIPTYVDIGDLIWSGRTSKGANFLLANGAAVSRSTFALLFAQYGTTFGPGDGSTTFNLPDLQGRMPVGVGTNADISALGANEGIGTVASRRPKHRTSSTLGVSDPGHFHSVTNNGVSGPAGGNGAASGPGAVLTDTKTTGITLSGAVGTNVGTDPADSSPYLALNPFVRVQ